MLALSFSRIFNVIYIQAALFIPAVVSGHLLCLFLYLFYIRSSLAAVPSLFIFVSEQEGLLFYYMHYNSSFSSLLNKYYFSVAIFQLWQLLHQVVAIGIKSYVLLLFCTKSSSSSCIFHIPWMLVYKQWRPQTS